MKPLEHKLRQYTTPDIFKGMGLYPFYHSLQSGQDAQVKIKGQQVKMFGSNSYLGLTNHPEIVKAAQDALLKYGTGASGSRLMNGNLDIHDELEEKLAAFVNKPAATIFSTGFQANIGTISCLLGRNDYILIDDKNHASIFEGCRLSFAKTLKYKHNDMQFLDKLLQKTDPNHITLIITDGVFSMEGDIAKLDQITMLAKEYQATVMVDDAHGLGVLGNHGAGTADHFGLSQETDIILGTFSKSLASLGGFVASDKATINYIKHNARSIIFSAAIPPSAAATVIKALEIMQREPERVQQLWNNTNYARNALVHAGLQIGNSTTPIIPIFVGEDIKTYEYATYLLKHGVYVNPVVHPAVEKDKGILRFSLMATHTNQQIDEAVKALVSCKKEFSKSTIKKTILA